MRKKYSIGYNKDWAVRVGRSEFLKQMDIAHPEQKEEHKAYADANLSESKKSATSEK